MKKSQKPLVSIIVPSLNQGKYIRNTIESCLTQDYRPIEVIVVDGASTDSTIDVLHDYDHNPEVTWVSEQDSGVAEAVNKGFNLSGGERRRTEIARTLVTNPKFILLDEPFAGVDPIAVQDIQNIVKNLKQRNIGVLITDHNVHETLSITDHAFLLFEGKVLKEGDSEALANDPEARKLYLGAKFKLYRE